MEDAKYFEGRQSHTVRNCSSIHPQFLDEPTTGVSGDLYQDRKRRYWWDEGDEHKGIRWMKWDTLCDVKEVGGLGFRRLQEFNFTIIAKQACYFLLLQI